MNIERVLIEKSIELYKNVLDEYNDPNDWNQYGEPPLKLVLECYEATRRTEHFYKKTLKKCWNDEGNKLTDLDLDLVVKADIPPRSGMFYTIASARFYWDIEKKKAFIDMVYGPRFARGYSFDIKEEDGSIYLDNQDILWVS